MNRNAWLFGASLLLAACGQASAPPSVTQVQRPPVAQSSHATASEQECFVAAAEAFEGLTEKAASAQLTELAQQTASSRTQARSCQPSLSVQQSATLDNVLGRMGQFETTHDRSALALAAVEGYRTFVTAQSRPLAGIPLEVSLLDYAGFRYQAGAHATPPLWSDMRQALDFADGQWRAVSPRVLDDRLKTTYSADLGAMRTALDASNQVQAQSAVSRELDQVDALERYFSQPRRN
jgi:hypothetical protein